MNYSWMNDGDLSGKSDRDYLGELVQSLTQDLHSIQTVWNCYSKGVMHIWIQDSMRKRYWITQHSSEGK